MEDSHYLIKALDTIITNRRSCQKFSQQIIAKKTLNSILNSANKCPSAYGLEPWKILVIQNQALKKAIQRYCDNQEQVSTCSHLFVVLSYKGKMFQQDSPWLINRIKTKRNLKNHESYLQFYYKNFWPYMQQIKDWDQWAIKQSYILLQTILLVATAHQVASLAMEAGQLNDLIPFLETKQLIKTDEKGIFNCPFVIALGYSETKEPTYKKQLNNLDETFVIVE